MIKLKYTTYVKILVIIEIKINSVGTNKTVCYILVLTLPVSGWP